MHTIKNIHFSANHRAALGRGGCGEMCVSVKQRAQTLFAFPCRSPLINYHDSLRDFLNLFFIITPVFKEDKVVSGFETSTRAAHSPTAEFHSYKSSNCSASYHLSALVQWRAARPLPEARRPRNARGRAAERTETRLSDALPPAAAEGWAVCPHTARHSLARRKTSVALPRAGGAGALHGAAWETQHQRPSTTANKRPLRMSNCIGLTHLCPNKQQSYENCAKRWRWIFWSQILHTLKRKWNNGRTREGLEQGQGAPQQQGNPDVTMAGAFLTRQLRSIRWLCQVPDWQKHSLLMAS